MSWTLRDALEARIEEWEERAATARDNGLNADSHCYRQCADDLAQTLDAHPPTCVECGDSRDDWPRDSVIVGELTRGDVNMQRRNADLDPICSRSCMLERYDEHTELFDTADLRVAPRFGGPGYREL